MEAEEAYRILSSFTRTEAMGGDDILKQTGAAVYRLIQEVADVYMDMDEDDRDILAAWIMAAAFHKVWSAFPILFVNANKGSGKTRLLLLISCLLPGSILVTNMSEAALFRIAGQRNCLLFDEAEKKQISNKDKVNLTELLNSCYKRGGVVVRAERTRSGTYTVAEYPVYVPVVLANIYGLASTIEDRSITIILRKTRKQTIIRAPDPSPDDPVIRLVREWFVTVSDSVGSFLDIGYQQCMSASFLINKYTYIYSKPSLTVTNLDVKAFMTVRDGFKADGRNSELWSPILLITFTFDPQLLQRVISIAKLRVLDKEEEAAEFDRDVDIAAKLYAYINALPEPRFYPKDFRSFYLDGLSLTEKDRDRHWMTSEIVGHMLKRMKIVTRKEKTNRGHLYTVSVSRLRDYLEARNALPEPEGRLDSLSTRDSMPQSTIPPTEIVQKTPISAQTATCPDCHTEQPLPQGGWHEWGARRMCGRCLTLARDPDSNTVLEGGD